MLSTASVKFDVSDCTLKEQSEEHLGWSAGNGVFLVLRVPKQRTNWSFNLEDVDAAKEFFSQQCAANGGALLEMEGVKVGGRAALRGLFKYRSPIPQSLGMMFVNILWVPLGEQTVQLNVESLEHGETGGREAAVCLLDGGEISVPAAPEPVMVSSVEEMLSHMRAQPLRPLPSDDARYDQNFPEHPLSKVRYRMRHVMETVCISDQPISLAKSKETKWWKFW